MNARKNTILQTNLKQKAFYNHKTKNWATRIWSYLRESQLKKMRKSSGMMEDTYQQHLAWFGDLSQLKVLDLGCYAGNHWSLHLAQHAREYVAIDLSEVGIQQWQQRIAHWPHAKAKAVDFLSDAFTDADFDLIYAYGVLHHFPDVPLLIEVLQQKLAPAGRIISYDPLQTSLPMRMLRALYRPFQSDAAWEWPFTKADVQLWQQSFDCLERRGILGKAKWAFLLAFWPMSAARRQALVRRWHRLDWEASATSDRALYRCMHLTMHLQKKA